MIIDKQTIYIKNIYYMLTYAFSVLKETNYESLSGEDFHNVYDLLAAVLYRAVIKQIKQGLYHEYVNQRDNLNTIRGKIDINGTIQNKMLRKQSVSCEFDEFTSNNKYNQIIKATLLLLIKKSDVQNERKLDLKRALIYFSGMDDIDTSLIAWNNLTYTKNNQTYQIIINICYFIIQAQLLSDEYGQSKMMNFIDEFMHRLYEKFILEYYKAHYKYLNPHAAEIKWLLDEYDDAEFLPSMISDIYLTDGKKILIIDAKYYSHTMQEKYGKHSYHSKNWFQIFAYVMHADIENKHNVKGMLLYAKTNESVIPNQKFVDKGYEFEFTTLDLNTDFKKICQSLDDIVNNYFHV